MSYGAGGESTPPRGINELPPDGALVVGLGHSGKGEHVFGGHSGTIGLQTGHFAGALSSADDSKAAANSFSNFSKVLRTPIICRFVKKSFFVFFWSKS